MSCPEEIGWEFGRFWKRFSWVPTMMLRSRVLTMVWRSWGPTMMLRSWVWPWCWEIEIGSQDVPNIGGVVSIVWFWNTFKNCVSPRVEELKSEINEWFVPEQKSPAYVFVLCGLHMYTCSIQQNEWKTPRQVVAIWGWSPE